MKIHHLITFSVCALGATLAGTSSAADTRSSQLADLAVYESAAGAPVARFVQAPRTSNSWKPLGDGHLLFQPRPSTAYLLKVEAPCEGLYRAQRVSVGNHSRSIHANIDTIKVIGEDNPGGFDCKIVEMRPVDLKKYSSLKASARS